MLQLPITKAAPRPPAIKRGPMKCFPDAKPYNCPVMALALQYEVLLEEQNKADIPGSPDFKTLARLGKKMDRIAERASWLSPTSFEGAAFQIMLASAQPGMIAHGTTKEIREQATKRIQRLLYRALDRLNVDGGTDMIPLTRSCHMLARCDQRNKSQEGAL